MSKIIQLNTRRTRCSPETGFTFDAATKRRKITGPDSVKQQPCTSASDDATAEAEHFNPMLYPELCSNELLIEHLSKTLIDPSGIESKSREELLSLAQTLCVPMPQRQQQRRSLTPRRILTPKSSRHIDGAVNLSPVVSNIRHIKLNSSSDSCNSTTIGTPTKRTAQNNTPTSLRIEALRNSSTESSVCPSPEKRNRGHSPVRFP